MKFQGFGQVMAGEKIIVNFKSGIDKPGIVDIADKKTIDILLSRNYKPLDEGKAEPITGENTMGEKTQEQMNAQFDKDVAKEEWRKAHDGKLSGFEMTWKRTHPEV